MIALIVTCLVAVALVGLLAGILGGHLLLLPADRRRLEEMTRAMAAELRIEQASRATLQAMREAARREMR